MNTAFRWTRQLRAGSLGVLALLVTSCAAPRLKPDAGRMQLLEQREHILLARSDWSLAGRMAISGPQDSGSGSLEWQQQGEVFSFTLHAPVSGKTWTLSGDAEHAQLTGLREQALEAANGADLLARELGWRVPVGELAYWVRGLRAPGRAEVTFQEDGLPAEIRQHGWTVEFRDYTSTGDPLLPRKIFASNGDYKVRLVVQRWD